MKQYLFYIVHNYAFEQIRAVHPYFTVIETGWSNTVTLFNASTYDWPAKRQTKTILYAPILQAAVVIVSDTLSIITEFGLLNKPILTFNNKEPEPHLVNVTDPNDLSSAIEQAINALLEKITRNTSLMHPYFDGCSSARILDATQKTIQSPPVNLKSKPLNFLRKLKMRKKLGFWF